MQNRDCAPVFLYAGLDVFQTVAVELTVFLRSLLRGAGIRDPVEQNIVVLSELEPDLPLCFRQTHTGVQRIIKRVPKQNIQIGGGDKQFRGNLDVTIGNASQLWGAFPAVMEDVCCQENNANIFVKICHSMLHS